MASDQFPLASEEEMPLTPRGTVLAGAGPRALAPRPACSPGLARPPSNMLLSPDSVGAPGRAQPPGEAARHGHPVRHLRKCLQG